MMRCWGKCICDDTSEAFTSADFLHSFHELSITYRVKAGHLSHEIASA